MKKIFSYLMVALAAVTFASCDKNNNDDPKDPKEEAVTFNISVSDITATTATVTVVPSVDTVTYYFDLLTAEEFAEFANNEALSDYYVNYFEEVIDYYAQYGYNYELADFLSTGEDGYDFTSLDPETEYMAFAFRFENQKIVGEVATIAFSTEAVSASDMTISFQVNDTAIFVVPSNDTETYFVGYANKDTLTAYGYTAAAYAQAYYDYAVQYYGSYFSYYNEYSGKVYLPLSELEGATEWFACGSVAGTQTTDWFYYSLGAVTAPQRVALENNQKIGKGHAMLKDAKRVVLKK